MSTEGGSDGMKNPPCDQAGLIDDADLVSRFEQLLERDPDFNRIAAGHMGNVSASVQKLIVDAGPIEDANKLFAVCTNSFKEVPQVGFTGDPSLMREYIEELIDIDPKVALGAVFDMANNASKINKGISEAHKAAVIERTRDLVILLNDTCQGTTGTVGLARLRTLLRYMLEPNYTQDTTAVELLSRGSVDCIDLETRNFVTWQPNLKSDDLAFDLGCGPGKAIDWIEKMMKRKGQVHGVEINPLNAMQDERIQVGVIDTPQETLSCVRGGDCERLSFEKHFNHCGLVFASLVLDRVANQDGLLMNSIKLLRSGGSLAVALLLPVRCLDDEANIKNPFQYAVDPRTVGVDKMQDYKLLASHLRAIGFGRILLRRTPVHDPVSNAEYRNHYLLIAEKK